MCQAGLACTDLADVPPLFLATECYNCSLVRPGAHFVWVCLCCTLECGCSCLFVCVCVCARVRVSVWVSAYIMVPAFVDAANERVCLRYCALFHSGYRDAPVTEHHGNRKWAGHLAHQWWGIPLASWHSGWLFDVPIGCLVPPLVTLSHPQHHTSDLQSQEDCSLQLYKLQSLCLKLYQQLMNKESAWCYITQIKRRSKYSSEP